MINSSAPTWRYAIDRSKFNPTGAGFSSDFETRCYVANPGPTAGRTDRTSGTRQAICKQELGKHCSRNFGLHVRMSIDAPWNGTSGAVGRF